LPDHYGPHLVLQPHLLREQRFLLLRQSVCFCIVLKKQDWYVIEVAQHNAPADAKSGVPPMGWRYLNPSA